MKNYIKIFFLLFCGTILSQDIIIKNDKTEIKAKVQEILNEEIKYKKWEMQDGPIYSLNKNEIFMIIYKNGTRETFEQSKPNDNTKTFQHDQSNKQIETISNNKSFQSLTSSTNQNTSESIGIHRINYGLGNNVSSDYFSLGYIIEQNFGTSKNGLYYESLLIYSNISNEQIDLDVSFLTTALGLNYGLFPSNNLKFCGGGGIYYITSFEEDIESVFDFYYSFTLDYFVSNKTGLNLRYDRISGFNFGISFKM